jgi:hypothetical protein
VFGWQMPRYNSGAKSFQVELTLEAKPQPASHK